MAIFTSYVSLPKGIKYDLKPNLSGDFLGWFPTPTSRRVEFQNADWWWLMEVK